MSRRDRVWIAAFVGASLGIAAPAAGQEDEPSADELAEMSLEELLGNVVSASQRTESLARAPATVTVIDADDIRASAARTVPELLRRVPGVQVIHTAPGDYVVSLRGMGSLTGNNVVVLLDGVPMNSPVDGEVDWSTLAVSVDDIERIEVVRGPVSPIYGANAYTGLIRIDTAALPAEDGAAAYGRVLGGMDTALQPYGEVSASFRGRRGALSATFNGHATLDDTFRTGQSTEQPGLLAFGLASRFQLRLDEHVSLSLDSGAALSERSALDYLVIEPQPQMQSRVYGRLALVLSELAPEVPTVTFWSRGKWLSRQADGDDYTGFFYDDTDALDGQLGVDVELALPEEIRLLVGADTGVAYVDAPFIHPDENAIARGSVGVYVNGDIDIADMFNLGIAIRTDLSAFAPEPQISARASAAYYDRNFSLRVIAASAYRNPTWVEVASRFRDPTTNLILLEGTAGLALPRVETIELLAAGSIDGRVTLQGSVFVGRAVDLVVGDFTPLTRKTFRTDTGEAVFLGAEVEAEWSITDDVRWSLGGAGIGFLSEPSDPAVTVGVAEHNSMITATTELRGTIRDARLDLALGGSFFSERSYNVRAGIAPRLIRRDVPHSARLHASAVWRPAAEFPLDLRLLAVVHLPHDLVESPLPSAGQLGSRVLLGVNLHTD